jgi:hypothetical protein
MPEEMCAFDFSLKKTVQTESPAMAIDLCHSTILNSMWPKKNRATGAATVLLESRKFETTLIN